MGWGTLRKLIVAVSSALNTSGSASRLAFITPILSWQDNHTLSMILFETSVHKWSKNSIVPGSSTLRVRFNQVEIVKRRSVGVSGSERWERHVLSDYDKLLEWGQGWIVDGSRWKWVGLHLYAEGSLWVWYVASERRFEPLRACVELGNRPKASSWVEQGGAKDLHRNLAIYDTDIELEIWISETLNNARRKYH